MDKQIQVRQQESTSVIIRRQGKTYLLNDLGEELKNFNIVEREIIDAREKGISLCDQNEKEFEVSLTGIIWQVSVICGCQLPTHEAHINALEKEFAIFLNNNGYSGLTTEEVLTAFRMNANFKLEEKVETYGAIFNIDFAAKVLRQYKSKRGYVDYKAEQIFYEQDVKKELDQQSNIRRKKIIEQFDKFLADKNADLDLENCYMQLCEDDAFKNKHAYQSFNTERIGEANTMQWFNDYPKHLDAQFEAQKKMVKYLFVNMKLTDRLKIYDENLKLLHPYFDMPEEKIEPIIEENDLPY